MMKTLISHVRRSLPAFSLVLLLAFTATMAAAQYINNQTTSQTQANFNIDGSGTANTLTSATVTAGTLNITKQFNLANRRILNATDSGNSTFGFFAGLNITSGVNNSFIGYAAGHDNVSGSYNSFVGFKAGSVNTLGSHNSFFGNNTGSLNTGFYNSFFGSGAGSKNTGGRENSFFGFGAGYENAVGIQNSFFGIKAGYSSKGSYNSFFGGSAGNNNTTGENNTFFGNVAGFTNTTGSKNVFVGSGAGLGLISGNSNTFVGSGAGAANSTGNYNTVLGADAKVDQGALEYATVIGAGAVAGSSNTISLGRKDGSDKVRVFGLGTNGTTPLCRNTDNEISTCSSSLRYKTNVAPFRSGLDLLQQLHPIRFEWKGGGMKDVGFGAEDIAAVEPLLVSYNDKGQVEGVKYDRITTVLVNAVKEQQAQIEAQRLQLKQQLAQIDALKKLLCGQNPTAEICKQ